VYFDNRTAMRLATQGLIDRGHRSILFIVQQKRLIVTQQRIEGLTEAAESHSDPVQTRVLECGKDPETLTAILAGEFQRKQRPTAIVVSNSTLAAWAIRALRVLRLNCPRDVSLMAFDQPEWADLVTPALSVVRQPTREIARMAWTFLMQRMRNEAQEVQQIQLEAQVIFRDSVRDLTAD
jgi:DNA-binding LacI/PurR family transcriptional regulator